MATVQDGEFQARQQRTGASVQHIGGLLCNWGSPLILAVAMQRRPDTDGAGVGGLPLSTVGHPSHPTACR